MDNIVLIGFMGTGKTTISRRLSKLYGMKSVDVDRLIAEREGLSISEIFELHGEEYFRVLETKLLEELESRHNTVVSCGGGAALRAQNVAAMKRIGRIVLLDASPETVLERVKRNDNRPLLRGRKTIEGISELMNERMPRYEAAADIIIQTDGKSLDDICHEIRKKI